MKLSHEIANEIFAHQFNIHEKRIVCNIIAALRHAEEKHPGWPKDNIHAAAILSEETGEVVQAALKHAYEKGPIFAMHQELLQVGAMVLRMYKNISLPKKVQKAMEATEETEPLFQKQS